jgi:hypothetical protein
MVDYSKLDPETRAFALVGQFLQCWAGMENSLHAAIGAALSIEPDKLKILCANIEFGNKIYTLRTLIDASSIFQKEEKGKLQKALRELGEYAKIRNMIAHNQFQPDDANDGVQFSAIKARGTFDTAGEIWSANRFEDEQKKIQEFQSLLERLKSWFENRPLTPPEYKRMYRPHFDGDTGFSYWSGPMTRAISPALASLLYLQSQAPPDSDPAIQKNDPQNPPKPEE